MIWEIDLNIIEVTYVRINYRMRFLYILDILDINIILIIKDYNPFFLQRVLGC